MPGWDGIETIGGLNMVNSSSKFLIISGHISETTLAKLEKTANIIEIIEKPFKNEYLLSVIHRFFEND